MTPLDVLLLYNEPVLAADDSDAASEASVLESVEAVAAALAARGHYFSKLPVGPSLSDLLTTLADLPPVDVVFNLFEGLGGVGRGEAEITGLVELIGLPVTGSPAECLGLVRDKARTKWMLAGAGLPTPGFCFISGTGTIERQEAETLLKQGPVIVKPAQEDASLGIGPDSIVNDFADLLRQVEAVQARYGAVLVEQFVIGREFNAAVIALPRPELLPLAEIEFSGPGPLGWQIVTYDAKWATDSAADRATPARCPAKVDATTAARIGEIALTAFQLAGCRDYARIDMRMDDRGQIYILEINGNPDIGPVAGFARALRVAGIAYEEFVERLVQTAFARRESQSPLA